MGSMSAPSSKDMELNFTHSAAGTAVYSEKPITSLVPM